MTDKERIERLEANQAALMNAIQQLAWRLDIGVQNASRWDSDQISPPKPVTT